MAEREVPDLNPAIPIFLRRLRAESTRNGSDRQVSRPTKRR